MKLEAEIIVSGLVQGVGFRYFIYRHAVNLGLTGYAKNLYTGEVFVNVEGEKFQIEDLINNLKIGPSRSYVKHVRVEWKDFSNKFKFFEII